MMKKIFLSFCFSLLAALLFCAPPAQAFSNETRDQIVSRLGLYMKHREMFAAGDYAALDKSMNLLLREYDEGKWSDSILREHFRGPFWGSDIAFEESYNKWVKAYPKSVAARLVRGAYYYYIAFNYYSEAERQTKITSLDQIPKEIAEQMNRYAGLSIKDNEAALKLSSGKAVLAYGQLLWLYALQGDREKSRKIYEQANKVAPRNIKARMSYMGTLSTEWLYKPDVGLAEMRKVIADVAQRELPPYDLGEILRPYYFTLLKAGQYEELGKVLNQTQRDYERGKFNDLVLQDYFSIFNTDSPEFTKMLDAWVKAFPKSYAARQARAMHFLSTAATARGAAFISDTSAQEIEGMRLYLKRAMADCRAAGRMTRKPVLTYRTISGISLYNGADDTRKLMLDMANKVDPKNSVVRIEYLFGLQGRWGGSLAEMESFVKEAKTLGLPDEAIYNMEDMILTEKQWLADSIVKTYSELGKLVTGF